MSALVARLAPPGQYHASRQEAAAGPSSRQFHLGIAKSTSMEGGAGGREQHVAHELSVQFRGYRPDIRRFLVGALRWSR